MEGEQQKKHTVEADGSQAVGAFQTHVAPGVGDLAMAQVPYPQQHQPPPSMMGQPQVVGSAHGGAAGAGLQPGAGADMMMSQTGAQMAAPQYPAGAGAMMMSPGMGGASQSSQSTVALPGSTVGKRRPIDWKVCLNDYRNQFSALYYKSFFMMRNNPSLLLSLVAIPVFFVFMLEATRQFEKVPTRLKTFADDARPALDSVMPPCKCFLVSL